MKPLSIIVLASALLMTQATHAFVLGARAPSKFLSARVNNWSLVRHKVHDYLLFGSLFAGLGGGGLSWRNGYVRTGLLIGTSAFLGAASGAPVQLLLQQDLSPDHPLCKQPESIRQAMAGIKVSGEENEPTGQVAPSSAIVSEELMKYAIQVHQKHISGQYTNTQQPPDSSQPDVSIIPEQGESLYQVIPVNGSHVLNDLSYQATEVQPDSLYMTRETGNKLRLLSTDQSGVLVSCLLNP